MGLADQCLPAGDVPVGAVVLDASGAVIGRGRNVREELLDPLGHAEVRALSQAVLTISARLRPLAAILALAAATS